MKSDILATLAERREAGFPQLPLSTEQRAALRDCLRHCDAKTQQAALRYWSDGDRAALRDLATGIVGSASDHDLRKLSYEELNRLSLTQDLAIDSLSLMEIGLLLEDALQISVNNNELLEMRTFGETVDYLEGRLSSLSAPSKSSKACAQSSVQPGDLRSLENNRGGIFDATAKAS